MGMIGSVAVEIDLKHSIAHTCVIVLAAQGSEQQGQEGKQEVDAANHS